MKVVIKSFEVDMEVKNKGIEFDVYEPNGTERLGDCALTKTGMIWCKGKTTREKGIKVSWKRFIEMMEAEAEANA